MNKKTFLLILLVFSLASAARAQTSSELLLTWEARNYTPPEYLGKRLATPGSLVSVSAEFVSEGKLADTRQSSFTWYVDGRVFQKGIGLKEISFPVQKSHGNEYKVRAVVRSGGKDVEGAIRIPTSRPEIVLEHPYQDGVVSASEEARLRIRPYFFTITDPGELRVSWSIDDAPKQTLSGTQKFSFSARPFQDTEIRVSARAIHPSKITEWREGMVRLHVR